VLFNDIESAVAELADARAGWVHRRDAAEALGRAAGQALTALRAHEDDADVDVRAIVQKVLGQASAAMVGIEPRAQEEDSLSLGELVKACEKPGQRTVAQKDGDFVVTVQLKQGRHQDVYVSPFKRKDGAELIRVFTYCGAESEEALEWALEANMKLSHCALALTHDEDNRRFVLTRCFLAEAARPEQVKAAVKEIAFYGDWIEKKLTGLDEL